MASQSKRRRVRYDRILAVLLVLILLIVLLVKCCSSCSSKKDKKNDNVTTTPTQATTAPTEADNTKTVYLSPSNQEDNKFYVGDTNEAAVCRILAQKTAAILEQSGVNVIVDSGRRSESGGICGDSHQRRYRCRHRLLLQCQFRSQQESGTGSI